jgi:germination protein M
MKMLIVALMTVFLVTQLSGCLPWPFNRKSSPVPEQTSSGSRSGTFVPAALPVSAGAQIHQRTLWLLDHTGRYLVPFVLSVPKVDGMAREAVSRLTDTAANRSIMSSTGLKLPLPSSAVIRGMTIRNGLAKIDFTEDFLKISSQMEKLAVDSVVYTLTEFPNVEKVQFMFGGKVIEKLGGGTAVGSPLSRGNRPLNMETNAAGLTPGATSKVILYFSASSDDGYNYYVPVTRIIPKADNLLAASIRELIKGPVQGSGLYQDVPASAKLNSVRISALKVAEMDLSDAIYDHGGGNVAETALLGALLLTVTEHAGVDGMKITVDGKAPRFPEGTDVSRPITRPEFVNPFIL